MTLRFGLHMTRVFETPRYKEQTWKKLVMLTSYASVPLPAWLPLSKMKDVLDMKRDRDFSIVWSDFEYAMNIDTMETADELLAYAYCDNTLKGKDELIKVDIANIILDILCDVTEVVTDDRAMYTVVKMVINEEFRFYPISNCQRASQFAEKVISDVLLFSNITSKVGTNALRNLFNVIRLPSSMDPYALRLKYAAEFMERFMISGPDSESATAMRAIINGNFTGSHDAFAFKDKCTASINSKLKFYKFVGLFFIKCSNVAFVFDSSAIDQVYKCCRYWYNCCLWSYNYRLSGDTMRRTLYFEVKRCIEWIIKAIDEDYTKVTRHMKICYARLINDYHLELEDPCLNARARSDELDAELRAHFIFSHGSFYNVICNLPVTDRCKLDIAYIFHGLPAPDCDATLMFRSFTTKLDNSNNVDEVQFRKFMSYTKSYDLIRILSKFKEDAVPKVKTEDGYDPSDKGWYISSVNGNAQMPPEDELGKCWIEGMYEFRKHMDYWYLEAADVTHVRSEIADYVVRHRQSRLLKEDHNELLYALRNAPFLNNYMTANQVRREISSGSKSFDVFSIVAAKSENTKAGAKVRETYSGSDILREVTSEIDRTGNIVTTLGTASTMRVGAVEMSKRFKSIRMCTSPVKHNRRVIMSLDVSGWSANACREKVFEHHDYVSKLSTVPDNYTLSNAWSDLEAIIDKRGSYIRKMTPTGMFQGFTGTLDTALHQHMIFYTVHECKSRGILRHDEAAYGLCLIDDGVIAIELSDRRTPEDANETCSKFMNAVIEIYMSLGFKIDIVKTICSNTKFTYLNRVFADGSEILTPSKVTCKIDREYNRKFSTVRDQISGIFGSGHSAVVKGEDPYTAYLISALRALEVIHLTNGNISTFSAEQLTLFLFAPKSMNGMDFPTMLSWLNSSITDKMLHFTSCVAEFSDCIVNVRSQNYYLNCLEELLECETEETLNLGTLENIRQVKYKDSCKAEILHGNSIRKKILKYARSTIFYENISLSNSSDYISSIAKLLSHVAIDASILEELFKLSPTAVVSPIVSKVTKNDLMNILLGFNEKRFITKKIKFEDRMSYKRFYDSISTVRNDKLISEIRTQGATEAVSRTRDRYYKKLKLNITNHTVSDPSYILTKHQGNTDMYTVRIVKTKMHAGIADLDNSNWNSSHDINMYRNFFDCNTDSGGYIGHNTSSIMVDSSVSSRGFNAIQNALINASILCKYVANKGNDGMLLWRIFMALWGVTPDTVPVVTSSISSAVSTKRLGDSYTSQTNMCFAYPNANDVVFIESDRLGRWLDDFHAHVDYMAIVGCSRISALLEYALNPSLVFPLSYTIRFGSVVRSDPIIVSSIDCTDNEMEEMLKSLTNSASETSCRWMEDTLNNLRVANEIDTIGVESIKFEKATGGVTEAGNLGTTIRGIEANLIQPGHLIGSNVWRNRVISDERFSTRGYDSKSRFRKLSAATNAESAFVTIMSEIVYSMSNGVLNKRIGTSDKADLHIHYESVFGNTDAKAILNKFKDFAPDMHYSKLNRLTFGLSKEMRATLTGGTAAHSHDVDKARRNMVMTLYLMNYGRFHDSMLYTSLALTSRRAYIRAQEFATWRQKLLMEEVDERIYGYKYKTIKHYMLCRLYSRSRRAVGTFSRSSEIVNYFVNLFINELIDALNHFKYGFNERALLRGFESITGDEDDLNVVTKMSEEILFRLLRLSELHREIARNICVREYAQVIGDQFAILNADKEIAKRPYIVSDSVFAGESKSLRSEEHMDFISSVVNKLFESGKSQVVNEEFNSELINDVARHLAGGDYDKMTESEREDLRKSITIEDIEEYKEATKQVDTDERRYS